MDKTDRNILSALCEDARIPLTRLAKKVRLKRETLHYRIQQLEKGVIRGYTARVNLAATTCTLYLILLRSSKASKRIAGTHWIAKISGDFNYLITFSADNTLQLKSRLRKILEHYEPSDHIIMTLIEEYKDDFRFYFSTPEPPCRVNITPTAWSLDVKDEKLIAALSTNARRTNRSIANEMSISEENVRHRIKLLEKNKVILGYRTKLDPNKMGYTSFNVLIKLHKPTESTFERIKLYLQAHPRVIYASRLIGFYDILIELYTDAMADYVRLMSDLQSEIPEVQNLSHNLLLSVEEHHYV